MYKVTYIDGTTFEGGHFTKDSMWSKVGNSIKELFYINGIKLSGYEQYNHLIERIWINGTTKPTKILLMGMKSNLVDIHEIDLYTGKTIQYVKQFGKEYNDKPTTGWKLGEIRYV